MFIEPWWDFFKKHKNLNCFLIFFISWLLFFPAVCQFKKVQCLVNNTRWREGHVYGRANDIRGVERRRQEIQRNTALLHSQSLHHSPYGPSICGGRHEHFLLGSSMEDTKKYIRGLYCICGGRYLPTTPQQRFFFVYLITTHKNNPWCPFRGMSLLKSLEHPLGDN